MNIKDISSIQVNSEELGKCFRAVAGKDLHRCKDVNGLLSKCGINVNGEDSDLTIDIYLDCLILLKSGDVSDIVLSNKRSEMLAKKDGKNVKLGSSEEAYEWLRGNLGITSEVGEKVEDSEEFEDGDEEENGWGSFDEEDEEYDEEDNVEEDTDESEEDDEDDEAEENTDLKEVKKKIMSYYYPFYKGKVDELAKRYTALFESGYEVVSPAGIISSDGLIGLSGNKRIIKKFDVAVSKIYRILYDDIQFVEVPFRSNTKIADTIYDSYVSGDSRLLYFPNKLLEYAYGRKAPSGDNKESLNTYENHSESANWSAYCKNEVNNSLMSVIAGSVVKFIISTSKDGDYFTDELSTKLESFLNYLQSCLSLCLLMVEYKSVSNGYVEDVTAFKLRLCDPENKLGSRNITTDIINGAFAGATGEVPFSYNPRFEESVCVKEYAHEFNHDSSQAMPLFAYKAYMAIRNQGVEPDWDNMILGMFEDGTILRNNKHGVSLKSKLTHHIDAGSRAGKGVMTLAILASAIYSNKVPFYLDRKPDMASMLKYLSPNMFAVNGAVYGSDDSYGTFKDQNSWVNMNNVPDYLCRLLELNKTWDDLGDLFYMRALKLVMGIIMARGSGKLSDPKYGGKDGILLIVDEFKNFQEAYALLVTKFKNNLPASSDKFEIEKGNLAKIKEKHGEESAEYRTAFDSFNRSYNNETFYALSYLNSMVSDLEFLSTKKDAGFDPAENGLSDIFVIGQHLEHGGLDFAEFRNMLSSGRYKQVGRRGITGTYKVDFARDSFGYSLVSFKTCDAFFGRNMDDGRDVYLAQTNKSSKAYGRLDDKASNFAYMASFTDEKRKKIVSGNVKDNVELANSCVYFKPFLVLNDAKPGDTFTNQMFARCTGPNPNAPWVTKEELIRENPNSDGSFINEAVGFESYLKLMGVSDYSQRLSRGSDVANYVVRECLGYDGTWLDFITDLRPQWLFTVKDIVDGSRGSRYEIENNQSISEFIKFNPEEFGLMGNGGYDEENEFVSGENGSVSEFMDDDLNNFFGGSSDVVEDREFDLNADDIDISDNYSNNDMPKSEQENDYYTTIKEANISETGFGDSIENAFYDAGVKDAKVAELVALLNSMGLDVEIKDTQAQNEFNKDPNYGGRVERPTGDGGFSSFNNTTTESVYDERIDFMDTPESYAELVDMVTNDVISRFGGLENIHSFKVIGGSIIINGYYYRCRVGEIFARGIPYDVRREMDAGKIDKLFNYHTLLYMSRLRDLEFDSINHVYDYVSVAMGYGSRISVDLFFRDLRALQCFSIGGNLFRRNTYKKQIEHDDVFYQPKLATKCALYSEALLNKGGSKSWEFTKNSMKSKDYGLAMKTLRVSGGLAATATQYTTSAVIKGGRNLASGIKSLGRSFKNILDETK